MSGCEGCLTGVLAHYRSEVCECGMEVLAERREPPGMVLMLT